MPCRACLQEKRDTIHLPLRPHQYCSCEPCTDYCSRRLMMANSGGPGFFQAILTAIFRLYFVCRCSCHRSDILLISFDNAGPNVLFQCRGMYRFRPGLEDSTIDMALATSDREASKTDTAANIFIFGLKFLHLSRTADDMKHSENLCTFIHRN